MGGALCFSNSQSIVRGCIFPGTVLSYNPITYFQMCFEIAQLLSTASFRAVLCKSWKLAVSTLADRLQHRITKSPLLQVKIKLEVTDSNKRGQSLYLAAACQDDAKYASRLISTTKMLTKKNQKGTKIKKLFPLPAFAWANISASSVGSYN